MKNTFGNKIYSRQYLLKHIEYAAKKARTSPGEKRNFQGGVNILMLYFHRYKLAKKLSKIIKKNRYVLEPAIEREAFIEGKKRLLYRQTVTDKIVSSAVASILYPVIEKYLSERIFSYRKGRSSVQVLTELVKFIQDYKRRVPDIKKRGLYVIKRDISKYGESIYTGEDSRLWFHFDSAVKKAGGIKEDHPLISIFKQSVRREIVTIDKQMKIMESGTPTGSPIQPLVNNIYLLDMDLHLENIRGGFYARYGDDFIFVHDDYQTAMAASQFIDAKVLELGLTIKDEKRVDYYITAPGKKSVDWLNTINGAKFDYLGCTIDFTGNISLKKEKAAIFLNDIKQRVFNINKVLKDEPLNVKIVSMSQAASDALDPLNPLSNRYAQLLLYVVNNQRQLKHLDYLIALLISKTATGSKSVKAFRQVSYKELRKIGLVSLVYNKNNLYKKKSI